MARSALEEADPGHAAHHAAGAIALDPSDPAAIELVDHLIAQRANPLARALSFLRREDDPAPLFPRGDFFGYVAVRARARWKRGQYSEAFSALISVMLAVPHVDFSPWVLELLAEAKQKGASVDPRPAFTAFAETSAPFIGLIQLRAGERAAFEPWVTINRALLGAQPPAEARDLLSMTTAGHLRRAGRSEEALTILDQVAATENVLVQRGLALRALGRFDEAVAVFEDAERLSGDAKHRAEIARARYDQGRFDLALQGFLGSEDLELTLAADACRLALGQPRERPDIETLFGRVPSYDELRRVLLGDGSQVQMSDATTNALANFVAEHPDLEAPRSVKMGVSCLESPSVLLALALFAQGQPTMTELPYTFESVPERSPTEPLAREGGSALVGRTRSAPAGSASAPGHRGGGGAGGRGVAGRGHVRVAAPRPPSPGRRAGRPGSAGSHAVSAAAPQGTFPRSPCLRLAARRSPPPLGPGPEPPLAPSPSAREPARPHPGAPRLDDRRRALGADRGAARRAGGARRCARLARHPGLGSAERWPLPLGDRAGPPARAGAATSARAPRFAGALAEPAVGRGVSYSSRCMMPCGLPGRPVSEARGRRWPPPPYPRS